MLNHHATVYRTLREATPELFELIRQIRDGDPTNSPYTALTRFLFGDAVYDIEGSSWYGFPTPEFITANNDEYSYEDIENVPWFIIRYKEPDPRPGFPDNVDAEAIITNRNARPR